jgi:hypothetical protein
MQNPKIKKNIMIEIVDYLRSCRRGCNIHWFMPCNYNQRFRNASVLAKICARTLERCSEIATIFCLRKSPPDVITGDKT